MVDFFSLEEETKAIKMENNETKEVDENKVIVDDVLYVGKVHVDVVAHYSMAENVNSMEVEISMEAIEVLYKELLDYN